jgi:3-oxoadipate enol-lactonase/4-carboxymuconolactone decarboxylase
MAFVEIDGLAHYYRDEGQDGRPVLLLSHSLGQDHSMWDQQVGAWLPHLRIIRYDTRGHGASAAPAGDYTIERLGRDALAVADAAGVGRFAWCGLSMGGMIGTWLAVNEPDRVTHAILANTSPRLTDPQGMESRRVSVLGGGMTAVAGMVMGRFFSPESLQSGSAAVASARRTLLATSPVGYAGCCAAIRDMDQRDALAAIRVPTLIVNGTRDISLPWDPHGLLLSQSIAGSRVVHVDAAHLSNLERPRTFARAVLDFLLPRSEPLLEAGAAVRRAVLGDAHVDASTAGITDLNRGFQELITRFAWGTVWTRPGLDVRTRRLLVIATTAALGRWEEFRLHLRTGFAHELELCDLEEVLLQLAVYAGVPAANTAFQIAADEHAAFTRTVS